VPLKPQELARLRGLSPALKLLFLAAEARAPWWGSASEIIELAEMSQRRGELGLRELEAAGYLVRETKGTRSYKRVTRFVPGPAAGGFGPRSSGSVNRDPEDRSTAIPRIGEPRSSGSVNRDPEDRSTPYETHARAPARPDLGPSLDLKRPSVREGYGEGHARTGDVQPSPEVRGSDVQWIRAQWAVSGTIAHQMLTKLTGEIGLSRREVREYLSAARRGTHAAFHGLDKANYPLGAACTLERVTPWRDSRARARPPVDAGERAPRVVDSETEAFVELARRAMEGSSK